MVTCGETGLVLLSMLVRTTPMLRLCSTNAGAPARANTIADGLNEATGLSTLLLRANMVVFVCRCFRSSLRIRKGRRKCWALQACCCVGGELHTVVLCESDNPLSAP